MHEHADKQYERELQRLKEMILKGGGMVEEAISWSMRALSERSSTLAKALIQRDREIDRLEMEIDTLSIRLLALRQPTGPDLRFIAIGLKLSTDLERIGDLAVNIAEQVLRLNREPPGAMPPQLLAMGEHAQLMVTTALEAFVLQDPEKAREVCVMDDAVDEWNRELFQDLVAEEAPDVPNLAHRVRLIFIANALERIADHATNLAEDVIFIVQGLDIRHGTLLGRIGKDAPPG